MSETKETKEIHIKSIYGHSPERLCRCNTNEERAAQRMEFPIKQPNEISALSCSSIGPGHPTPQLVVNTCNSESRGS
jgi:hypothetical protein